MKRTFQCRFCRNEFASYGSVLRHLREIEKIVKPHRYHYLILKKAEFDYPFGDHLPARSPNDGTV
jgi:hypothetical protein